MSTIDHDSCALCDSQHVRDGFIDSMSEEVNQQTKRQIFHDPCARCDDVHPGEAAILCRRCKHLRIPHIFSCVFELEETRDVSRVVTFDLPDEKWEHCAFCIFLASSADKILRCSNASVKTDVMVGIYIYQYRNKRESFNNLYIFAGPSKRGHRVLFLPLNLYRGTVLHRLHDKEDSRYLPPYLNWSWVNSWVTDIQERQDCSNKDPRLPFLLRKLQHVLVIDVVRGCVVDLPLGAKYLALSYVWGANSEHDLQCTTVNRKLLEQPGSLGDVTSTLPKTIFDAILACSKLNYQFLWVDRLCIMQDHPEISEQLDQMAAIYHQAALTMIGLGGHDATYGLPGVSNPRKEEQLAFRYADSFGLAHESFHLGKCEGTSTWGKRGWTLQEHLASSVLLFFSDSGLFVDYCPKGKKNSVVVSEGPTFSSSSYGWEVSGLSLAEDYSARILGHRHDKLRAISGILHPMYEGQIAFGIPLSDFEIGIMWRISDSSEGREPKVPGLFPTWSWVSVSEKIQFLHGINSDNQCSLAFWGCVEESKTGPHVSYRWKPTRDAEQRYVMPYGSRWSFDLRIAVALALLNHCFLEEIPSSLTMDCSAEEWQMRARIAFDNCQRPYMAEGLRDVEQRQRFLAPHTRALCAPGRIVANTQKSTFQVDWNSDSKPGPDGQYGVIRTNEGKFVGSILLDDPVTHRLKGQEQKTAEFIALAVIVEQGCHPVQNMAQVSNEVFYGHPCTNPTVDAPEDLYIRECDKNTELKTPMSTEEREIWHVRGSYHHKIEDWGTQEWAYFQHWRALSYRNHAGEYLHGQTLPGVEVMMIAPGPSSSGKGKVYQRLGIGRTYLKSWVESSPTFETVVLE